MLGVDGEEVDGFTDLPVQAIPGMQAYHTNIVMCWLAIPRVQARRSGTQTGRS